MEFKNPSFKNPFVIGRELVSVLKDSGTEADLRVLRQLSTNLHSSINPTWLDLVNKELTIHYRHEAPPEDEQRMMIQKVPHIYRRLTLEDVRCMEEGLDLHIVHPFIRTVHVKIWRHYLWESPSDFPRFTHFLQIFPNLESISLDLNFIFTDMRDIPFRKILECIHTAKDSIPVEFFTTCDIFPGNLEYLANLNLRKVHRNFKATFETLEIEVEWGDLSLLLQILQNDNISNFLDSTVCITGLNLGLDAVEAYPPGIEPKIIRMIDVFSRNLKRMQITQSKEDERLNFEMIDVGGLRFPQLEVLILSAYKGQLEFLRECRQLKRLQLWNMEIGLVTQVNPNRTERENIKYTFENLGQLQTFQWKKLNASSFELLKEYLKDVLPINCTITGV